MDKELGKGCLATIAAVIAVVVLFVGLSFALGWAQLAYTNVFGVRQENANTSVIRCSNNYLQRVMDSVQGKLDQIARDDTQIADLERDPSNAALVASLKTQERTTVDSVYADIDSLTCEGGREQLFTAKRDALQAFFDKWNQPTHHNYSTLNP